MDAATTFVEDSLNGVIWNLVPWFLVAAGVYFGLRTLFVQIRMVPDMFKAVSERPKGKDREGRDLDEEYGGLSAFKAFTISAASRVGTGNIAGVALAISIGGPGAVFWMWMLALLGGATAFVESTLAQLWKTKDSDGNYHGGPAYYMTRGLGWKPLAVIFSAFLAVTYGFVYNAIQTNSIAEAVGGSLGNDSVALKAVVAGVIAVLTVLVIFGGVTRIASWTQVIVPFMAGVYILIGIAVVVINWREIPGMVELIVGHAIGLEQVAGAGVGAAFAQGMRRGLFSNEAGMGSAPNAAATATVSHPVKQGLVQTLGVYFDTAGVLDHCVRCFAWSGRDLRQGRHPGCVADAVRVGGFGRRVGCPRRHVHSVLPGVLLRHRQLLPCAGESAVPHRFQGGNDGISPRCHRLCYLRRVRLRTARVGAGRHDGRPVGHFQHHRHCAARRRGAEAAEELQ